MYPAVSLTVPSSSVERVPRDVWLMETPVILGAALPKLGPGSCSKRQPRGGKLPLRGPRWEGGAGGREGQRGHRDRQTDRQTLRHTGPGSQQKGRAAGAPVRAQRGVRAPRPD